MRGWAAVAGLVGMAVAVTALLMWLRWRQFGAAVRVLWPGPRHRRRDPVLWVWLVGGLAAVFNGGGLAVRNPAAIGDHAVGVVILVGGAVSVTLAVGGLLIERRWNRR
jgi:hypothetical protein